MYVRPDASTETVASASESVFGDVAAKIALAVDEEVGDRRRRGLPVVVDRGAGVEVLPPTVV